MAKYTELFAEYLESGGELPAAFSQIEGFSDLFVAHYCDKEIGFETETLFHVKLEERAAIIIPAYVKRIAATEAAWLVVDNPSRTQTRTFVSGEKKRELRELPMNDDSARPSQTSTDKSYTDSDTSVYEGVTQDEAIRRLEYLNKLDSESWIILNSLLNEFNDLFMKVY